MKLKLGSGSLRGSQGVLRDAHDSSRAWKMAWTLGWTEMVSWGILFYAFSVLLVPMQNELGWSTGLITGAYSLSLLVSGLVAPWVGRRIDHFGARGIMTIGSILGTLLLISWANVHSWQMFYLIWIGLGVTMGLALYDPAFAAITPWFQRHRGRAMLIITFFGGLASTVFLPLTGWLEVRFGWRDALLILAAILAINTILPHAVVLRAPPGLTGRDRKAHASNWRTLLRDVWFQRLSIAFFLQMFTTAGVSVHMIAYLLDRGVSSTTAAWIAGSVGIFQTLARVLVTVFERRLQVEAMTALMFALQMVAIVLLVLVPEGIAVYIAALLLGIGRGALTLLRPAILLEHYRVQEFGAVNGTLASILTFASAAAPVATGIAVGWLGGYELIFALYGAASLTAAVVLWSTRSMPAPSVVNAP